MREFQGSYFEIGQQLGAHYARNDIRFSPPTDVEFLKQQIRFYEQKAPELFEEVRGIAAGGGFPFENVARGLWTSVFSNFRKRPPLACSIGGFVDQASQIWIARNYDGHPAIADHVQGWRFHFPDRTVVGISDMNIQDYPKTTNKVEDVFTFDDAINSDGLYVGLNYAHCFNTGVGLTPVDMVKLIALRCKNVDDVLTLFAQTPLGCPKNFFVADRAGQMAVIHHAVRDFDVRRPDADGLLVMTNHYEGRLSAEDEVFKLYPEHSSKIRFARLAADLKQIKQSGGVSFDMLDRMMSNPDTPVCQSGDKMMTVWTLLSNPARNQYRLISGPRSAQRVVQDFTV